MDLKSLIYLPAYYRDRWKNVNLVQINHFGFRYLGDDEKLYIFNAITNGKYITQIAMGNLNKENYFITPESQIVCDCTCQSFKFEFAKIVADNEGLLRPLGYYNIKPKQKNKFNHLTGCKHLVALARFIFHRKIIFEQKIKGGYR